MFEDFKNNIDFFIRNNTKFSRKNYIEKNQELIARYDQESKYLYDILDSVFEKRQNNNIKILDIGCKNWYYAKGEHSFFASFCNDFKLDGVEIDAYRLYNNFYTRFEVAKFFIKNLENTNYIAGNLLELKEKYDYIIWLLPFVVPEPLMAWGLPKKFFCPDELLKHAYNLLKENGQMLIINQGEKEAEVQKELLKKCFLPHKYLGEIKSRHFAYKYQRYGFLIDKNTN